MKVVDDIYRPLKLYCDYNLTVQYAHNISQVVLPNILTEYYVVKDKVRDQVINLDNINTERMLADPLTKGLPPNMFRKHGVKRTCS